MFLQERGRKRRAEKEIAVSPAKESSLDRPAEGKAEITN